MDAIRFEPTVSAAFSVDRRPDGGGDLFADMLGEQMKKRVDSERDVPVTRRRQPAERRLGDNPQAEGRPVRPVIKHNGTTIRGEAKRVEEERRVLEANKAATGAADMDTEACVTVAPVEQQDTETEQPAAGTGAEIVPTAEAAAAAPAAAAPAIVVPQVIEDMAGEPVVEETVIPAEPGAATPAEEPTPQAAAGGETEIPTAAGFAAALAASQAETAAAALGGDDTTAAASPELQATTAADLATVKITAMSAAAAQAAPEQSAEAVAMTTKLTPEAPRPAEPAKARPARTAPVSEIKAQQTVPTPAPQVPAQPPAAQALSQTTFGEAGQAPFAAAFDGDGLTMPGWSLHLAQGAGGKRPDFIAQLRQQLRDLPAHEQVAVNIQRAMREGAGRVSIQLSPVELGQIHVKLDIDEEKRVTAAVTVEKPSTLELLQKDVKALERALQEAGLKMDGNDLSFSLGRQDGKEFAQDLGNSGHAGSGGTEGEAQDEAETQAGVVAQLDTATGLVNLEI